MSESFRRALARACEKTGVCPACECVAGKRHSATSAFTQLSAEQLSALDSICSIERCRAPDACFGTSCCLTTLSAEELHVRLLAWNRTLALGGR